MILRKFYSWLLGKKIGQKKFVKASPFRIGNVRHFLPTEMWTQEDKDALRYCIDIYEWSGFS